MRCIILGGGISGLSVVHYMKMAGIRSEILLLEASKRLGGFVESLETPSEALFINGPRTIRVHGESGMNALTLIEELGLEKYVIPYEHNDSFAQYLKLNSKLVKFDFGGIFNKSPMLSTRLIKPIMRDLTTRKSTAEDESVHSFFQRRFCPEAADRLADALIRGVFAGDARKISVRSGLPSYYQNEQQSGSFLRGHFSTFMKYRKELLYSHRKSQLNVKAFLSKWQAVTLMGGLSTLVNQLVESNFDNVEVKLDSAVVDIVHEEVPVVKTASDSYPADFVISTLPANRAASLFTRLIPSLAKELNSIPYATMGLANLEFEAEMPMNGFGYLVPSSENGKVLGVVFDSCMYPASKTTVLTVMMGGTWFEEHFGSSPSEEELLQVALEEISSTLGIKEDPINYRVTILRDCIPQYNVGHFKKVRNCYNSIENSKLPLLLTGNSFEGVGISDTILNAKKTVEKLQSMIKHKSD